MAITVSGITIDGGLVIEGASPPYVSTGLVTYLDAGNVSSYPGSGTTWTSLVGGYTGTMGAGVSYSSASGGSMVFNGGSTATVNLINTPFRNLTNNFSVEFWYSSTNNRPALVSNGSGANGFIFGWYTSTGTNWKVTKYGVIDIQAGQIPQNTSWHQAVLTYSSTNGTRVYIDGAISNPTVAGTANLNPGSTTFNIGLAEGTYHNGSMAIVRWYNTVLSASDVSQNFNADRDRFGI